MKPLIRPSRNRSPATQKKCRPCNVFLGILGHDLRTPLNAILLGSDVLLRMADLGARPTKIASRIYTSVKRASQIVGTSLISPALT
ncbi:MAG: histidine kinase dimerization/phospho-acceptor domain-containing protein [Janthinobacterium lividum]